MKEPCTIPHIIIELRWVARLLGRRTGVASLLADGAAAWETHKSDAPEGGIPFRSFYSRVFIKRSGVSTGGWRGCLGNAQK